jgi:hypothetical protein
MTETKSKQLNAQDRCDRCGAQAYVWVNGIHGDLLFCGHHYNKIINDPVGNSNMISYAIEVIDERDSI